MTDFKNQTPAEIDTALAEFYRQRHAQEQIEAIPAKRRASNKAHALAAPEDKWRFRQYDKEGIEKAEVAARGARVLINVLNREEIKPREAEYNERHWTRAYFVTNTGGHVHTSRRCGTCFPTTQFSWVTSDSGKDTDEIVEEWGESACAVCHPTAPTFPRFREPSRRSQAEKAEREAEKAAKADKKAAKRNASIARQAMSDAVEAIVHINLRSLNAGWGYDAVIDRAEESVSKVIVSGAASMDELMKKARAKWNRDGHNKPPHIWFDEEKNGPRPQGDPFPGVRLDEE